VQRSALGPGGRDMTRLAGSSSSLWMSIVQDNTPALVHSLAAMENQLRSFREALEYGRSDETRALLDQARDWFDGAPMDAGQP
jgi:prephenate dehydrogenase